jgi:hypothetical protein
VIQHLNEALFPTFDQMLPEVPADYLVREEWNR